MMRRRLSIANRLYLSVLTLFLVFAVAFIVYQHYREKEYKIEALDQRLQDFNANAHEALRAGQGRDARTVLASFLATHGPKDLRLTMIDRRGTVVFDNMSANSSALGNHASRPEVAAALRDGRGSAIERSSATMGRDYFYSATYFPHDGYVLRSALPYNANLAASLRADRHYIWFAIVIMAVLVVVLYRFVHRLGRSITRLNKFAARAGSGGAIEPEELAGFSDDELGDTAERIVKLYLRLQRTQKEQYELKKELTENAAHELKTPVATIQGYLETILDNPSIDPSTQRKFIERSYVQSQRMASLLSDMSTLARLDDGAGQMEFGDVDLAIIIRGVVRDAMPRLEQKHMTLEADTPDNIPLRGNRELLRSIFLNLTDNAINYAGEGVHVSIRGRWEGGAWHFTFSDNGIGVAPEHLPRLFERFYRVDKGRSRKMGGTGLGLAIVKNAVMVNGGSITAANNPGGGLRFDFTLR